MKKIITLLYIFLTVLVNLTLGQKPAIEAKTPCLLTKSNLSSISDISLGADYSAIKKVYPQLNLFNTNSYFYTYLGYIPIWARLGQVWNLKNRKIFLSASDKKVNLDLPVPYSDLTTYILRWFAILFSYNVRTIIVKLFNLTHFPFYFSKFELQSSIKAPKSEKQFTFI